MGLPNPINSARARILSAATILSLAVATLVVGAALPATADTTPTDPTQPATVTADALPTAQIDGVAWSQVIVGNTVYVGGSFANARPAGSAAGTNNVPRTNLLAYNLTTGALLPWAPTVNAQVRSLAVSPDGTRLYAGGDFTTINGVTKNRIAAFDLPSGNLSTAFQASANGQVRAVTATNSTVYFGGPFSQAKSIARAGAAAALASNGVTTSWAPSVDTSGFVYALTVNSDGSKVVLGGSFATINGSSNPGYGLAAVDGTMGAILPWNINSTVRDAGANAAIFSLTSDADSVYGTGYVFGAGGNLEGSFRADWAAGNTTWIEDCHGDSYSVAATTSVVYVASHSHYCGNIGGFPQATPWGFHRATAFTKAPSATQITPDIHGYPSFAGQTAPTQLDWYPSINTGTYTGQTQGAWSVAANDQYAVYGGEFTQVNGTNQQGLVRFAVKSLAPNKVGPTDLGTQFLPTLDSPAAGTVRVSWIANWDMDNENLTYQVFRNNGTTPIYTTTFASKFWLRPNMNILDTGLTPGQSYSYKIKAIDPSGNVAQGSSASVIVASTGTLSPYAKDVLAAQPTSYFRLGEAPGSIITADSAGSDSATVGTGVALGQSGAIANDSNTAASFDGTSNGSVATSMLQSGPNTFTLETWFKTTSTTGGKIVGFGDKNSGNSGSYDRHIYMNAAGNVKFGVYNGTTSIIGGSGRYNDGAWHYVVASLSKNGMQMTIDGRTVPGNPAVTYGQDYSGYWRVGGDSSWEGANYFQGSIDDFAVYPTELTRTQILAHYADGGGTFTQAPSPSDKYGAAVYAQNPALYWRLDEASGTVSRDAGPASNPGTYSGTYSQGEVGALSGNTDTATQFGNQGVVSSNFSFQNPTVYTTQAWFKTTTTQGGKITGFGDRQTGTSQSYDRHVYMQNDGTLVFGTYTGQLNEAISPLPYNDGKWHQVTATQGAAGMVLYVDGQQVATNSQISAQNYTGYWRVGGDTTWGSNSPWFDGTIDEFAVYPTALSASVVANLYSLGSSVPPANVPPTAAFTATTKSLAVSVDASASSDSDGTVASSSWNWGDGSALSTGVTATHTYAAAGNFAVVLTVTDNGGATGTKTVTVTTTAPAPANMPPVAAFTSATNNLAATFDGTSSNDPDGTIASWTWNYGDSSTGTGATSSHTYATAGTYTVTLTVTDNGGASTTITHSVTVTAPPAPPVGVLASDTFMRNVTNGWGTADTGGAWTSTVANANYFVSNGTANHLLAVGSTRHSTLATVSSSNADVTVQVSADKAATGGGYYVGAVGRQVGTDYYQARIRFNATSPIGLQIMHGSSTVLANLASTGLTYTPGQVLQIRTQVTGLNPTTIRAKVWVVGTTEPTAWMLTATDATAGLQTAGYIGTESYLSSTATNAPITASYRNLQATTVQ